MHPQRKYYSMTCLVLFILLSLHTNIPPCFALEAISTNYTLSGDQSLTSGNFRLGFFKPGNSNNYYIGMWYNSVPKLQTVWVANREKPVTDHTSSHLKIGSDGNLVLVNQYNSTVWSTDARISSNVATVAVLVDNGNLVLRDEHDSSNVFWESFDHLTDTWLPGAKIGINKITNRSQYLTAWKNSDDPAPGVFSHQLDPTGTSKTLSLVWNFSKVYWDSGTFDGFSFNNAPQTSKMRSNTNYSFTYVNNENMRYFTFQILDDNINYTKFAIDISGQITLSHWVESAQEWVRFVSLPAEQCKVYAYCGPFGTCNGEQSPQCKCVKGFSEKYPINWELGDHTAGCTRNTKLHCQTMSSVQDKFYSMPNMRLPDNLHTIVASNIEDCESACLNKCTCTAYSYNSSTGCMQWYGDLINLQEEYDEADNETLYLRLAASEFQTSKHERRNLILIAVGTGATFVVCLVVVCLIIFRFMLSTTQVAVTLVPFTYRDLKRATKNFSLKLGEGSFGSVYKGLLSNSIEIAVKMIIGRRQGDKQFRAEVTTIGAIHHVNLVRLFGFCAEGKRRILVYEYMPNGSLAKQLFKTTPTLLDWKTRYQIAIGIARGLAYLHDKCRDCIVHCDIKPENILLDGSFVPKIADFGLAKIIARDFSRILTTMRGTRGYLAPEWICGMTITTKADVYSYGMMLFEIISGKRNMEDLDDSEADHFPTVAAKKLIKGNIASLLDESLKCDVKFDELERVCKLAFWCIQDSENLRPTMGLVVQILEGIIDVQMPPIPSMIIRFARKEDLAFFYANNGSPQVIQEIVQEKSSET